MKLTHGAVRKRGTVAAGGFGDEARAFTEAELFTLLKKNAAPHDKDLMRVFALTGMRIEEACWSAPHFDRTPGATMKAWINATIGNGWPVQGWPPGVASDLKAAGVPARDRRAKDVAAAVLAVFPFLGNLPIRLRCGHEPRLVGLRLQWLEAGALAAAMRYLAMLSVPSLLMHDGLIVARSNAKKARFALAQAFHALNGTDLHLKTSSAPSP